MMRRTTVLAEESVTMNAESMIDMIDREKIASYMQPIVDLYSGTIFGYEMLARGEEPFFYPVEMFSRAEEWGLSWELEYGCRKAALNKIAALTGDVRNKYFFLNVSPQTVSRPEFRNGFTMKAIEDLGIDNTHIVLEVTETTTIGDYNLFEHIVRHYIEQGFRIALDDFGSGHSGLITLVAVTPHYMKIDRELISGIHRSSYKQNLVRMVCGFADNVGSNVLAEGVETIEELRTAFKLGARYAQGYYLGKPNPEPAVLDPTVAAELKELPAGQFKRNFAVDLSISRLINRPPAYGPGDMNCSELFTVLLGNPSISHVIITGDGDEPLGVITREFLKAKLGGRYGYAVYGKRRIHDISKRNFLMADENIDLRILEKLAMSRDDEEVFEPVVITDSRGGLVGTVSMKRLLALAFDTEIKLASGANPLTQLPGNTTINVWLEEIVTAPEFSIVYADLDSFKEYNDTYGFASGDDMIRLVAEILSEVGDKVTGKTRIGHIGGDDFIILFEKLIPEEYLQNIATLFDSRKLPFFKPVDVETGYYYAFDRQGKRRKTYLPTLSLAAITSSNFEGKPHQGVVGQVLSEVKHKVKAQNKKTGISGYAFEQRTH